MFGGGAPQEDMFAKLESMREIITEVNNQFKDPVRESTFTAVAANHHHQTGEDNFCLCLHLGIPLPLRNRATYSRTHFLRNRHSQHCR